MLLQLIVALALLCLGHRGLSVCDTETNRPGRPDLRQDGVFVEHGQPRRCSTSLPPPAKKADVVKHPEAFDHVGLLIQRASRHRRVALHLVIRRSTRVHCTARNAENKCNVRSSVVKQSSYFFLASRKRGDSVKVKSTTSSPVRVLMS